MPQRDLRLHTVLKTPNSETNVLSDPNICDMLIEHDAIPKQ